MEPELVSAATRCSLYEVDAVKPVRDVSTVEAAAPLDVPLDTKVADVCACNTATVGAEEELVTAA